MSNNTLTNLYKLNSYIDWIKIWEDELEPSVDVDFIDEEKSEMIELVNRFKNDKNVELLPDECHLNGDEIIIFFGECGGIHEGDSQGWSRDYCLCFDYDFNLTSIFYSQG